MNADIPAVWIVPLFEDIETLRHIEAYLDRVWEYAVQSRRMDRTAQERLSEMICELFIAGSDLSQQVGQRPLLGKNTKLLLWVVFAISLVSP